MIKDMLLIGERYGFEVRNLCFCCAIGKPHVFVANNFSTATGLNVVEPLAVVAHAAAGARLHEF